MAAPFIPLAAQRSVRLITLGIGKSNRTLVPIGRDYQVLPCTTGYGYGLHRRAPTFCVTHTTQAVVSDWDTEDDEDEEEDEDGVRALGRSSASVYTYARAPGSAQQRCAWPAGAHRALAASRRVAATASRVDAHKARRALGRKPTTADEGEAMDHFHLGVELAASTAAKLTAGTRARALRPLCP